MCSFSIFISISSQIHTLNTNILKKNIVICGKKSYVYAMPGSPIKQNTTITLNH